WFRASDFFPVPCCAPTCRSITYLLTDGEDVVPVPRLVPIESALDYLANRALPDTSLRELLEGLWSASAVPGSEATTAALTEVLAGAGLGEGVGDLAEEALSFCASCGVDLPGALGDLAAQAFMIVIQDFQDPYTLNTKTLQKCCVHELVPDGRIIPFCAYNAVGYREQVREALSGAPVPDLVPNATELDPLLATTAHGARTRAPAAPAAPVRVTLGGRLR
ncbi:MAG TPA: hypothetical protein VE152_01325, partial [Acidimicrobiales bacterium]|nr:hypothetical protein [Acidimicrobiales bacterium]